MSEGIDYSKASEILTGCLALRQSPVAICFSESIPEGIGKNAGAVPAGCKFWEDATRASFSTAASDHELCAVGVYTHNLQPSTGQQTDLRDALKVFSDLGYLMAEDVASIPVLQSRPQYVVYSPLAETPLAPDVVILFVNASHVLLLTEATQQVESENPPAMGRPACAVIPQVMNTRRAALSLGCCGARTYLDVLTEDVAVFAIPGAKLQVYVQRIEALANANSVLSRFHGMRRREIEAGHRPTIMESLAAFGA